MPGWVGHFIHYNYCCVVQFTLLHLISLSILVINYAFIMSIFVILPVHVFLFGSILARGFIAMSRQ